jgi:hypothetical protein
MKKAMLRSCAFALALFVFSGSARSADDGDKLIVPKIKVFRIGTGFGAVTYINRGEGISAFQFDLTYDTDAFQITPSIGTAAEAAGKQVFFVALPDGIRVLVFGFNQNIIADGEVVILSVQAKPASEERERGFRLNISNQSGAAPDGTVISLHGEAGEVIFRERQ